MTNEKFSTFAEIVKNRRTVKPAAMNGKKIPDETVQELLKLADWAPTHGRTEPWRFYIYGGEKVQEFCQSHATLYKANASEENFMEGTYNNLRSMGDKASHVIVAVMKRGDLPKIPAWEELAATSAAIEHVLLGASSMGIASFWSTGGVIQQPAMKTLYDLRAEDVVMGALYFGYTDEQPVALRKVDLKEKLLWM